MLIPAQDANKIKHNVIETFFTMELQLFGINHKTSNVAEREKFIINESNQILLDSHLKKLFGNDFESFFGISTCNRTEIYLVGRPGIAKHIFKEVLKLLNVKEVSKFTIFGEPVISLLARSIGDVKYMKLKSSNSLSINICNLQTKCRFVHKILII